MNDKIRELAEQSGFFPMPESTEGDWEFRAENARYEKFAELIIKECCIVADVAGKQDLLASSVILDYFGVEE